MFDENKTTPQSFEDSSNSSLLLVPSCLPSRSVSPMPHSLSLASNTSGSTLDILEELRQAKREIELLRSMDPFQAAEMAIELQVEKIRAAEATSARDSAVQRLSSAYDSIKEKVYMINRLQNEKTELEQRLSDFDSHLRDVVEQARSEERLALQDEMKHLRDLIHSLKSSEARNATASSDSESTSASTLFSGAIEEPSIFPVVEETENKENNVLESMTNGIDRLAISTSISTFRSTSNSPLPSPLYKTDSRDLPATNTNYRSPLDMVAARNSLLASLPIPIGIPEEELKPIMIPAPFSIHEFLGNTTGSLRNSLSGYRVFHEKTTRWCPERDEHGYFLTPLFKCTTKPRVTTAHTWSEVDPKGRMVRPTECFYNREGKWYYAGQYIAIRLDELNVKEWEELDQETASILVKETLVNRKNTTPTVQYEVSQLYSAGALKVACVGLQCVGFNSGLYHTIVEQANKCQQNGRWKIGWGQSDFPATDGSENVTNAFNTNAYPSSLFNYM